MTKNVQISADKKQTFQLERGNTEAMRTDRNFETNPKKTE